MIELPRSLRDALIAHAREGRPNEVCGVVGLANGRVVRLERARNAAGTPQVRFTFGDDGYLNVIAVERAGLDVGIYHSHPASPAYPSATDRAEMSATWPHCVQLMVSLRFDGVARPSDAAPPAAGPGAPNSAAATGPAHASGPEVNAYRIDERGTVTVEELRIVDDG